MECDRLRRENEPDWDLIAWEREPYWKDVQQEHMRHTAEWRVCDLNKRDDRPENLSSETVSRVNLYSNRWHDILGHEIAEEMITEALIEVGVIVWSMNGEDIGKKIALPGTIVVMEKAKHCDWLDHTRFLLKGFR